MTSLDRERGQNLVVTSPKLHRRACLFLCQCLLQTALAQTSLHDTTFNLGPGANATVNAVIVQPDGQIVVAGDFTEINHRPAPRIARLNPDGSFDSAFHSGAGANAEIVRMLRLADGRFVVGGLFTAYDGQPRYGVARLNADGTLDSTFTPPSGSRGDTNTVNGVYALALGAEGKLFVGGGDFDQWPTKFIERLNRDGSADPSFAADDSLWWRPVMALLPLPDGGLLAGGQVAESGATTPRGGYVRLRADGSLDPAFVSGWDGDSLALVFHQLPDQRILVAGHFMRAEGSANLILRLNPDLSRDSTFLPPDIDPQGSPDGWDSVSAVLPQPDGRLLAGGHFYQVAGYWRRHLVRAEPDGRVDLTFETGFGCGGFDWAAVRCLALDANDRILVAGAFQGFDGVDQCGLVRLLPRNDGPCAKLLVYGPGGAATGIAGVAPAGQTNVLEVSTNLREWAPISTNPPPFMTFAWPNAGAESRQFCRLRQWP